LCTSKLHHVRHNIVNKVSVDRHRDKFCRNFQPARVIPRRSARRRGGTSRAALAGASAIPRRSHRARETGRHRLVTPPAEVVAVARSGCSKGPSWGFRNRSAHFAATVVLAARTHRIRTFARTCCERSYGSAGVLIASRRYGV